MANVAKYAWSVVNSKSVSLYATRIYSLAEDFKGIGI